mmetsp:Transcript_20770/g.45048  ORF Transcript_20770/g.45048 Transcript_20770/m.45048 type:complete len:85 (+) Transcript_20770:387-641(+)
MHQQKNEAELYVFQAWFMGEKTCLRGGEWYFALESGNNAIFFVFLPMWMRFGCISLLEPTLIVVNYLILHIILDEELFRPYRMI